jgi:hypothetical protein
MKRSHPALTYMYIEDSSTPIIAGAGITRSETFLWNWTDSGSCLISVQFQRKVLSMKSPTIDQYHFCRWSPRCLNVASTIELLTTSQVNLQYGFQSGKSTTAQMLYVLHEIHNVLEKRGKLSIKSAMISYS